MNKHLKSALGIGFFVVAMGAVYYSYQNSDPLQPPPPPARNAAGQSSNANPSQSLERQRRQEENARRAAEVKAKEQAIRDAKFAEVSAIRMAQFKELGEALSKPAQWRILPSFIYEIGQDFNGNVWFTTSGLQYDHREHASLHFRNSIENFATSKTPLIHLGRLVLLDRSGRIWGFNDVNRNVLQCFDPVTKQWTFRSAKGEANPSTTQQLYPEHGKFSRTGWEDESGNLFFIAGAKEIGFNVHRFSRHGEWSTESLLPPGSEDEYLIDDARVALHPNGRVVLYPRRLNRFSRDELQVHYFDGTKWATIQPFACKTTKHKIEAIIPLPSGAIASVCEKNCFWLYWPPGSTQPARQVEELVMKLDEADPVERQRAINELISLGPDALEQVRNAQGTVVSPGGRNRFDAVIKHLQSVSNSSHEGMVYGGRYVFGNCYYLSQSTSGQIRLYVEECKDLETNDVIHSAMVTLDKGGKWSVRSFPLEQWHQAGMRMIPHNLLEDSKNGIWLKDGRRLAPDDGAIQFLAPDGLAFQGAIAEDTSGAIYFEGEYRQFVMFDQSKQAAQPALPQENYFIASARAVRGEQHAFGVLVDEPVHTVARISGNGVFEKLPVNWPDHAIISLLIPLKNGVLLGMDTPHRLEMWIPWQLWDGEKYLTGSFDEIIHNHAAVLSRMASTDLVGRSTYKIASDGNEGLWFWTYGYASIGKLQDAGKGRVAREQIFVNWLEYFDGKQWHDVWKELNWDNSGNPPVKQAWITVEGGAGLLVEDRNEKTIHRVAFDRASGKMQARQVLPVPSDAKKVETARIGKPNSPEFWLQRDNHVIHFIEGEIEYLSNAADVFIKSDASGRRWYRTQQSAAFKVVQGDNSATLPKTPSCFLLESPDKRMWRLNSEGISRLVVNEPELRIEIAATYPWGAELNDIDVLMCDENNGLWLKGQGNRLTRIQLPE